MSGGSVKMKGNRSLSKSSYSLIKKIYMLGVNRTRPGRLPWGLHRRALMSKSPDGIRQCQMDRSAPTHRADIQFHNSLTGNSDSSQVNGDMPEG
jgi:hypothetical protein